MNAKGCESGASSDTSSHAIEKGNYRRKRYVWLSWISLFTLDEHKTYSLRVLFITTINYHGIAIYSQSWQHNNPFSIFINCSHDHNGWKVSTQVHFYLSLYYPKDINYLNCEWYTFYCIYCIYTDPIPKQLFKIHYFTVRLRKAVQQARVPRMLLCRTLPEKTCLLYSRPRLLLLHHHQTQNLVQR